MTNKKLAKQIKRSLNCYRNKIEYRFYVNFFDSKSIYLFLCIDNYRYLDMIELFKMLSNEHRILILSWLKDPHAHFAIEDIEPEVKDYGVCMSVIQKKAGISQSTTSSYLSSMVSAGLLKSVREGQWTYYKRNEEKIQELGDYIKQAL